jgi:Flp pilus assembly protein TadB
VNDGNFRRPPPDDHWNMDQHAPTAPSTMSEVQRRQVALEQQMMEAKLEIIRSRRQQNEARVSRVVMFLFVFAAAGLTCYVLDKKGYDPRVSIVAPIAVLVVIGTWWVYRKPY